MKLWRIRKNFRNVSWNYKIGIIRTKINTSEEWMREYISLPVLLIMAELVIIIIGEKPHLSLLWRAVS